MLAISSVQASELLLPPPPLLPLLLLPLLLIDVLPLVARYGHPWHAPDMHTQCTFFATQDQLGVIFNRLGTMSDDDIADVACADVRTYLQSLPKKEPSQTLEQRYPGAAAEAIALLRHMVHMNPNKRCTVEEALAHPYLADIRCVDEESVATEPIDMAFDSEELSLEQLRTMLKETVLSWQGSEKEPTAKRQRR